MHDTLLAVAHRMQADTELLSVLAQCGNLGTRGRFLNQIDFAAGDSSRNVVVLGCDGQIRAAHLAPCQTEAIKSLWRGNLVDEVQIDINQIWFAVVALLDYVVTPDFLGQSLRAGVRGAHSG